MTLFDKIEPLINYCDSTAPIKIRLSGPCNTIGHFIGAVLEERPKDWGRFTILDTDLTLIGNFDYRYGQLVSIIPTDILCKEELVIKAVGSWSRMDYTILLTNLYPL